MNNKSNKRDKVLNKKNKKGFRYELLIPVVIIVVGLLVVFIINGQKKSEVNFGNTFVSYKEMKAKDGIVKIPTAQFDDYKTKYYKYEFPDKSIYFFAVKSADGTIRAAFDSCDVCFREKKGYRQEGDVMVCNNCGQTFPTEKINVEKGGCNPAPLIRSIDSKNLVINVDDLYQGVKYF